MDTIITGTMGLLVAAIAVAFAARRLRLPYTVGLVIAGIAMAAAHLGQGITLTHDFVFELILPPLLFEAAINIHWRELRRDAAPILVLASVGTLVAAACMTAGMVFILGWPPRPALLFGVLIAATDPVAVIAMFRDNGVHGRPRLLVESESLFNDGVAAVLFALVLIWIDPARDAPLTAAEGLRTLLVTVGGGVAFGLGCGLAATKVSGQADDHLIESTLTTVCAYGSFLLAEHFHVSGVLATVTAGLVMGNMGLLAETEGAPITAHGRRFALELWEFIAFLANSLVFLLIGQAVAAIAFQRFGAGSLLVVIALSVLGRALTVYPLALLFARSRWAIPMGTRHVLWWGGLRGALSLALALSLPETLPYRGDILIATFGTVVFSVIVQGLSMPRLLRAVGLVG